MACKTRQKDQIVKESNALARAKIKPAPTSVWDMRVIMTIAALNKTSDEVFMDHKIDLREANGGKALSTRQFNEAKKAVRQLIHKFYEFPYQKRGIGCITIFSTILIDDNGVISARFNPDMKPYYLGLRKYFTLLSLPDFQKLTSIYSQKLYEVLGSWQSEGEITIPLTELHNMLGVPASFTKKFSSFQERVLDVAHREINAAAENSAEPNPLEFDWEPVRKDKRKVIAVRFIFNTRDKKFAAKITETNVIAIAAEPKPVEVIEPEATYDGDDAVKSSGRCYIEHYNINGNEKADCKPDTSTERCQYCLEYGRKSREPHEPDDTQLTPAEPPAPAPANARALLEVDLELKRKELLDLHLKRPDKNDSLSVEASWERRIDEARDKYTAAKEALEEYDASQ